MISCCNLSDVMMEEKVNQEVEREEKHLYEVGEKVA